MPREQQLLFIPSGSMLILEVEAWNGGIVGSPIIVHFIEAIILMVAATFMDELVYRGGSKK